jgi:hypothetical protein
MIELYYFDFLLAVVALCFMLSSYCLNALNKAVAHLSLPSDELKKAS